MVAVNSLPKHKLISGNSLWVVQFAWRHANLAGLLNSFALRLLRLDTTLFCVSDRIGLFL